MIETKYQNVKIIIESLKSTEILNPVLERLRADYGLVPESRSSREVFESASSDELFLLCLSDEEIKTFFQNHMDKGLEIAILPNETCPNAIKNFGLSKDISEAIEDAFNDELLSKVDILSCNEYLSLNRVVIGDMHGMNRLDFNSNSAWGKTKIFFTNLIHLKFKNYTLTTSKDQIMETAASGITILDQMVASENSTIGEELSIHDGKLNAFVLAPTSLLSYVWYLVAIFFYQRVSLLSLPKSLGFIKTSKLIISSSEPMDYLLDDNLLSAKEIQLEVFQDCINLHLGRILLEKVKNDDNRVEEKDVIKLNALPKGELKNVLIDGKLPFFRKAGEDDFRELFISLRSSAKFSYIFATLMILSVLLATTGLFANSTPVIIGAMVLAPLMAPIISLSMGVIRSDKQLLAESLKTLGLGIAMALFFSAAFTFLIPLEQITPEMRGRLNPNVLDLMVAIFSGVAGAYAYAKEEVAKSLAGVAIAVALVPPLSVSGVGIGLGDFDVIYGSFLLFSTNLVGIALSAALTFIVLGFAPVKRAKKGIIYASIMMAIIAVPLVVAFKHIIEANDFYNKLKTITTMEINHKNIELKILNIQTKNDLVSIDIEAISTNAIVEEDLKAIKTNIEKKIQKRVALRATPILTLE
jgi:uncharacterized hydrophobic protein (TIGR00271 family)